MKKLFLILNMFFITIAFSQNIFQTGQKLNITQQVSFVMDGDLDLEAVLLSQNGNLELYTGFDGIDLYVAGNSAVALGQDVFILVAESPGALGSAMWAKAGLVAQWDAFLGSESTNGWSGWFDNTGTANSQTGTVVEGTINVIEEWGTIPDSVFIALATYITNDGGALVGQTPIGNGNVNIDANEFAHFHLIAGMTAILYSPLVNTSFGDPQRAPYFLNIGDSVNVAGTYVTSNEPIDSLFLYFDDSLVEQSNQDTINNTFYADTFGRGMHKIKLIAIGTSGTSDTSINYIMINPDVHNAPSPAGTLDGINYNSNTSVTLSLFAPEKEFVYLVGDFNDWKIDTLFCMNRDSVNADSVHWWLTLTGLTSGQEYAFQYLVDSDIRIADPYTEKVLDPWNDQQIINSGIYPNLKPYPIGKTEEPVSVFQTNQTPFTWVHSDTFVRPEQKDLIIYEMLVRDFIANHDYSTLADTLDYFQNLGINAIELMPVNEFEGNSSWGYNPSFYFAPDKYYGPSDNLKMFIDECHGRGIAVILDIVLNHSFGQSPLVRLYWDDVNNRPAANNPWYNVQSPNPTYFWGSDFDHESTATQTFIDRVNSYWITEYKFDGFRFDFTKGFTNTGGDGWWYDPARINILKRMADKIWETDSTAYVILEHLTENAEEKILAEYNQGMMLWGNLNHSYNEATMGYHENGKSDFSWGYYGNRGWNAPALVTYMESHDEERLMYKNVTYGNSSGSYDVQDTTTALNRIKMAAAFFLTYPGPKMIWQFQELGYDYSIDYNGRIGEKPIRWDYYTNNFDRQNLYKTFVALNKLRRENEVFTDAQTVNLWVTDTNGRKRIKLTHPSMNAVIIGNFDVISRSINPDFHATGIWYDYFSGDSINVSNVTDNIALLPGEFHVYTDQRLDPPEQGILNSVETENPIPIVESFELAQNYPNPFNPMTTIRYNLPVNIEVQLEVYNIAGEKVATIVNEFQNAGDHHILWDGNNFNGNLVSSGIYFYRLKAGDFEQSKKMIFIK